MERKIDNPSLKTIGKKCGIAVSTVSAILNNEPSCFAGKKLRSLVIKIAREVGYRPNFIARSLRTKKSYTIGIIAPNLQTHTTLANLELIENLAWKNGYHLFIGYSQNNVEKEETLLSEFISRYVDGVVLIVGNYKKENRPYLEKLISENFPLVAIGELQGYNLSFVSTDYYQGGKLVASHLLELGHRNTGIISFAINYLPNKKRVQGFVDRLKEEGLEPYRLSPLPEGNKILTQSQLIERGYVLFKKLLNKKNEPTAIFCSNDELALGATKAALEQGLKVPEEISIIGFDDSSAAQFSFIPLTTIGQKREEISKTAFEILKKKIEGKLKKRVKKYVAPELIIRSSTAPLKT